MTEPNQPFFVRKSVTAPMVVPFPINKRSRIPFDPRQLFPLVEPGNHVGFFGQPGSGKTAALFWYLRKLKRAAYRRAKRVIDEKTGQEEWLLFHPDFANYVGQPEMIILNEIGKWETLALSQYFKIRLFLPEESELELRDEDDINLSNIKTNYFDVNDIPSLISRFSKYNINIVAFEPFYHEPDEWCAFWGGNREKRIPGFFAEIKEERSQGTIDCPVSIFYDQIDRIAPSKGSVTYAGQSRISTWLSLNAGDFRSAGMRIVGTAWRINTVNPNLVNDFNFLFFKKTQQRQDLGETFEPFYNAIKALRPRESFVITKQRNYDPYFPIPMWINPKEYFLLHKLKPTAKKITASTPSESDELFTKLVDFLTDKQKGPGFNKADISTALGFKNQSQLSQVLSKIQGKVESRDLNGKMKEKAAQFVVNQEINKEGKE